MKKGNWIIVVVVVLAIILVKNTLPATLSRDSTRIDQAAEQNNLEQVTITKNVIEEKAKELPFESFFDWFR